MVSQRSRQNNARFAGSRTDLSVHTGCAMPAFTQRGPRQHTAVTPDHRSYDTTVVLGAAGVFAAHCRIVGRDPAVRLVRQPGRLQAVHAAKLLGGFCTGQTVDGWRLNVKPVRLN